MEAQLSLEGAFLACVKLGSTPNPGPPRRAERYSWHPCLRARVTVLANMGEDAAGDTWLVLPPESVGISLKVTFNLLRSSA